MEEMPAPELSAAECKSKNEVLVSEIPFKPDLPADALKPSRNPPLDRLRWPSASSPDANANPDQYGVLRLARSPTQSYTRQLQTKYLDEKYKHKRSKANMGR